jgi:16S rRNA (uracil1498-N3)-methyltransferase
VRLALDPDSGSGLRSLARPIGAASLLVGPEGGLSGAELKLSVSNGFTALRLGPRVLRTETAAMAALAALQTLHGDLAQ